MVLLYNIVMASPQLENGYTQIANEIIESLCTVNLSPHESRVLWAIFRKTYGYKKKKDKISLSQIDDYLKIGRTSVSRALKKLECKKIVFVDRTNRIPIIEYNKNYNEWGDNAVYSYRDTRPWYRKSGQCEFCLKSIEQGNSHKHHIIPRSEGGKDISQNVAWICIECHEKVHQFILEQDINSPPLFQQHYNEVIKSMSTIPRSSVWLGVSTKQRTPLPSGGVYQTEDHKRNNKKNITKEMQKKVQGKISAKDMTNIYRVIEAFKPVNKFWHTLEDNPKQMDAAWRMIQVAGVDAVLKVIAILPKTNKIPYVANISSPVKLEEKWSDLEAQLQKLKSSNTTKNRKNVIIT